MVTSYNKLVRDRIPEIILAQGRIPVVSMLAEPEYRRCLLDKLREETEEYINGPCVEELSDIFEVLYAIMKLEGISWEALEDVRKEKAARNGAFDQRFFLEKVHDAPSPTFNNE